MGDAEKDPGRGHSAGSAMCRSDHLPSGHLANKVVLVIGICFLLGAPSALRRSWLLILLRVLLLVLLRVLLLILLWVLLILWVLLRVLLILLRVLLLVLLTARGALDGRRLLVLLVRLLVLLLVLLVRLRVLLVRLLILLWVLLVLLRVLLATRGALDGRRLLGGCRLLDWRGLLVGILRSWSGRVARSRALLVASLCKR